MPSKIALTEMFFLCKPETCISKEPAVIVS